VFRRYAFVRQNDQSDCGAAALAAVALHHRLAVALEQLRDLAGTDRVGANLLGLLHAAEKLGFAARAVHGAYENLPGIPLPAVAHLHTDEGMGHFVVLHRVTRRCVVIADPARGVETLSREEVCRRWTGYLLLLTPERLLRQEGQAPVGPWRRFVGLLSPNVPILLEGFVCALLMTVLGVASSYFLQHLVDSVLVRNEGSLLNALGAGMLLVLLFKVLFGVLRQYLLAHVSRKVDLGLISAYTRHLLRLPLQFFEMRRVGDILARVHDADKVREAVSGTTLTTVVDGTLVVVLLVVLWTYDLPLALLSTLFVPLMVAGVAAHHPASVRRWRRLMEQSARLSSHLVEDVSGIDTVKAFGCERSRAEEGESHLVGVVQSSFALQKLGISMTTLGTVVTAVAGLVVLWYGGHRVMAGALTVGQLLFFSSLLAYLLEPLERLASVNLHLQEALVAVDRLYQVLDGAPEPLEDDRKVRLAGLREGIELREVSFRYGCRGNVLEKVDLRVPAGKTVAIVGESGSGKSTLLKLLLGFYAPTEGRLLFDGVDLGDLQPAGLRRRIGLVSQEPFIFNGSVRDNIALGRPGASLEEVIAAARAAQLDEFISGLPERYDTVIGERGANLSGGQRQRLAIARALLRQPDVLIFDEATSHLDTATERAIQESLKTVLAGKTVVLVAHRLSTVKDADHIYVLHQGRVAEEGTHWQLLAAAAGMRGCGGPRRRRRRRCGPSACPCRPATAMARTGTASCGGRAMREHTIGSLSECSEFRQTLRSRPPAVVHGTALLLAALLAAAAGWAALAQADLVVRAPGRMRPVHPAAPVAAPAGRIAEVRYREGDVVKRGAVLLRMDTERLDNEVARKKRAIQAFEEELARLARQEQLLAAQREQTRAKARAKLTQAREEVRQARERRESDLRLYEDELRLAADEEKRQQRLGVNTSLVEVQQAKQRRREAEEKLAKVRPPIDESRIEIARRALELAEKEGAVRHEELAGTRTRTQAELDAARSELANLELEQRRAVVRAPTDGVVITPEVQAGDLVERDKVVAEVAPPGGFLFEAVVPGEEVGHLKVGRGDLHGRVKLGMAGQAEVVTGRQSLLSILLKKARQSIRLN
jgi:ATP-binding cassette subfamily B protein